MKTQTIDELLLIRKHEMTEIAQVETQVMSQVEKIGEVSAA